MEPNRRRTNSALRRSLIAFSFFTIRFVGRNVSENDASLSQRYDLSSIFFSAALCEPSTKDNEFNFQSEAPDSGQKN